MSSKYNNAKVKIVQLSNILALQNSCYSHAHSLKKINDFSFLKRKKEMDLIYIFTAFLSHFMKDIPHAWRFNIIKNSKDLSELVDHATYLITLIIFSCWFAAMCLNTIQKFTGRFQLRDKLLTAGIMVSINC